MDEIEKYCSERLKKHGLKLYKSRCKSAAFPYIVYDADGTKEDGNARHMNYAWLLEFVSKLGA